MRGQILTRPLGKVVEVRVQSLLQILIDQWTGLLHSSATHSRESCPVPSPGSMIQVLNDPLWFRAQSAAPSLPFDWTRTQSLLDWLPTLLTLDRPAWRNQDHQYYYIEDLPAWPVSRENLCLAFLVIDYDYDFTKIYSTTYIDQTCMFATYRDFRDVGILYHYHYRLLRKDLLQLETLNVKKRKWSLLSAEECLCVCIFPLHLLFRTKSWKWFVYKECSALEDMAQQNKNYSHLHQSSQVK